MNDLPVGRPQPHPPCDGRCACGCHEHDEATYRPVGGFCPMGCGETLGVPVWQRTNDASMVACHSFTCPDPRALEKILRDPETEHRVTLNRHGFTIHHPLKERLGDSLESCVLHQWLSHTRPEEADRPGRYRVVPSDTGWRFILISPEEVAK